MSIFINTRESNPKIPHKSYRLGVCRLLKTSPATRVMPILVLTALASPEDKLKGYGRGADDYLTKPFEMSELVARVFALLRRTVEVSIP